jgi:hypothetical protein
MCEREERERGRELKTKIFSIDPLFFFIFLVVNDEYKKEK